MISNQILQNTIDGLKGITRIDLCIIDVEGKILAATFPDAEVCRTCSGICGVTCRQPGGERISVFQGV